MATKGLVIGMLLAALIVSTQMNAQSSDPKWMVGINGGVFIYQGDLTPSYFGSYRTLTPVAGLNVTRILNPYFAVRANLAIGSLHGNDAAYSNPAWRQQRNFSFHTPVTELSGLLVWNMFGNNNNELGLRFTPYVFAGAGINKISVSRDYSRLNRDAFPGDSKTQLGLLIDSVTRPPGLIPVIPMGAGVAFYISRNITLNWETNFRYTFTDYLDGFSYAANVRNKDAYHSHTIGLMIRLGKRDALACPAMKY